MKETLFQLHTKWLEDGDMSHGGLCESLARTPYAKTLDLFHPSVEEFNELQRDDMSTFYWGSGLKYSNHDKSFTYTKLRQAIVLMICAIHNEI